MVALMYLNLGSAIGLKDLLLSRGPIGIAGTLVMLGGLFVLINGFGERTKRKRRNRFAAGGGTLTAGAAIVALNNRR